MEYLVTFLEGIISFISPCLLPMVPLYISYFMGQSSKEEYEDKKVNNIEKNKGLINSLAFVLGFTIVFILLGVFASTFGMFIKQYINILNIVFGLFIILFGISYIPKFNINLFNKFKGLNMKIKNFNFFNSMLFGVLFSISWTPCIGTFLGSALMLVASTGDILKGTLMLFTFSLGLGIPFILSAILIDKLKGTFEFVKKNYNIINIICGILLIILGLLVCFGLMERLIII